nr:unnamed protein product [Callosobruchus analis]
MEDIDIETPKSAGSFYYNYKRNYSIGLLGLTDANYTFLYVDIGVNGRISGGGVFRESGLKEAMEQKLRYLLTKNECQGAISFVAHNAFPLSNRLTKPYTQHGSSNEKRIFNFQELEGKLTDIGKHNSSGSSVTLPHVLVGDEAYLFKTYSYLMRPYPSGNLNIEKTILNKRLSRTRVTIECAFAILSNNWRVCMKSIETYTKHTKLIIKVASLLHNIIYNIVSEVNGYDDQYFRGCTTNLENRNSTARSRCKASSSAPSIRDQYKNYFVSNPR